VPCDLHGFPGVELAVNPAGQVGQFAAHAADLFAPLGLVAGRLVGRLFAQRLLEFGDAGLELVDGALEGRR